MIFFWRVWRHLSCQNDVPLGYSGKAVCFVMVSCPGCTGMICMTGYDMIGLPALIRCKVMYRCDCCTCSLVRLHQARPGRRSCPPMLIIIIIVISSSSQLKRPRLPFRRATYSICHIIPYTILPYPMYPSSLPFTAVVCIYSLPPPRGLVRWG